MTHQFFAGTNRQCADRERLREIEREANFYREQITSLYDKIKSKIHCPEDVERLGELLERARRYRAEDFYKRASTLCQRVSR